MSDVEKRRLAQRVLVYWSEYFSAVKKTADTEEDRLIEGRGGGYIKESVQFTGDDPLYAALAASFVFFVWASSGGLSLH